MDPNQTLVRGVYEMPRGHLKFGENQIAIAVLDGLAVKIGEDIHLEKIELSVKTSTA